MGKGKGRVTRILIECPENIASVRAGIVEPLRRLVEANKCEIQFKRSIDISKKDIVWCDVLITVRGSEYITLMIARAAKAAGRYIIYFLDDDLLNIPKDISCTAYYEDKDIQDNIKNILKISDLNWCVNPMIAEKYKIYSDSRWVIENVPVSLGELPKKQDETINILYAGSKDHTQHIRKYISPVALKLQEEFGDKISFTFIGVDPKLKHRNIKYISYFEDFDKYKAYINSGQFNIGLAPVATSEFYKCKYFNKFIEYSSIGAVGIYTDSLPYTAIIQNEVNGVLCANTFEGWYDAIKKLIIDKDLRDACIQGAYDTIQHNLSYESVAAKIETDIPHLTQYISKEISVRQVKLENTTHLSYAIRLKRLIKRYGIGFIPIILYKVLKKSINWIQRKE